MSIRKHGGKPMNTYIRDGRAPIPESEKEQDIQDN